MKTFKMSPINGRKSMPNHHVNEYINSDGSHYSDLISYTTRVASYNHDTNQISICNCQSQTTRNHINSFLYFYGFDTMSKKQMENFISINPDNI